MISILFLYKKIYRLLYLYLQLIFNNKIGLSKSKRLQKCFASAPMNNIHSIIIGKVKKTSTNIDKAAGKTTKCIEVQSFLSQSQSYINKTNKNCYHL